MIRISMFSLLAVIAGCSAGPSSSQQPGPAAPAPAPPPTETPREEVNLGGLGASCGEGDLCVTGTCVRYYGIAGARGPQFSSCEIPCAEPGATCPTGASCITIADGPGAVCRPDAPAEPAPVSNP